MPAERPLPPGHVPASSASGWVVRFAPLVATGARVLDLACGYGRHARFFAARGHQVIAVDRDPTALATLAGEERIVTRALDLEVGPWPWPEERFDAIVVANYLHRPLYPFLLAALAADGVLIYETFARGNEAFGRPANPDFLLERDELLQVAARGLTVVAFEQGLLSAPERGAVVQRLAAVGPARSWPPALPPG
jgi:SAM-dependent methyltransferase